MPSENPIHCQLLFTMLIKSKTNLLSNIGEKIILSLVRLNWEQKKEKQFLLLTNSVYVLISDL